MGAISVGSQRGTHVQSAKEVSQKETMAQCISVMPAVSVFTPTRTGLTTGLRGVGRLQRRESWSSSLLYASRPATMSASPETQRGSGCSLTAWPTGCVSGACLGGMSWASGCLWPRTLGVIWGLVVSISSCACGCGCVCLPVSWPLPLLR